MHPVNICYIHDGPQREIATHEDLSRFTQSEAFNNLHSFLQALNASVKNKKLSQSLPTDPNVKIICNLLNDLSDLVDKFPPSKHINSRFGNPVFREWFDAACDMIREQCGQLLEKEWLLEVTEYLTHSLGSRRRIDYGTGHEAHFVAFLYCLNHLGCVALSDQLVFHAFVAYLGMIRKVQSTYWLEPAGSLGVWGLDDYHFLPFLFGSAQLCDHPHLTPKSIHDAEVREAFRSEYLYYDAISMIFEVKGPFLYQHSPMLDDISGVKTWDKVNSGLLKMYFHEVFSKLPVMQHFIFGRIIEFKGTSNDGNVVNVIHEHHVQGDCCGNALPSAFPSAAVKHDNLRNLPSMPFD